MRTFSPDELPIINGKSISLRPICDADTELIVRWRNDPEVFRYFIFREPFTPEMHQSWLRTKVASGKVVQYIILAGEARRPVGSVYFRDIDEKNASAEYGIFIGESCARGIGLGTETASLFTEFGFTVLGLHRISLKLIGGNERARRSYEKAGFVYEGLFRDMVKLDGKYSDIIFMAKLNGEE